MPITQSYNNVWWNRKTVINIFMKDNSGIFPVFEKCRSQRLKWPFAYFLFHPNCSSFTWSMLIPVSLVSQLQEHKSSHQTQCSVVICSILSLILPGTGCFKDRSKNFSVSHFKIIYHPLRSHHCFYGWRLAFILKHEVSYPSKHTVIINYSKSG